MLNPKQQRPLNTRHHPDFSRSTSVLQARRPGHPGRRASHLNAPLSCAGFTLPEFQVAISMAVLLAGGLIAASLFSGWTQLYVQARLNAADKTRNSVAQFVREVREAATFQVGSGNVSAFTPTAPGAARQGNAIQIYLSGNTNEYIRYFQDSTDMTLKRIDHRSSTPRVMARAVTNQVVFTGEDARGNVTTNVPHIELAGMQLFFNETIRSGASSGRPSAEYNQVRVKAAKRVTLGFQY